MVEGVRAGAVGEEVLHLQVNASSRWASSSGEPSAKDTRRTARLSRMRLLSAPAFALPSRKVVQERLARWKRRRRLPEVVQKGVVGGLQALLGSVGCQALVHAAVGVLAMS